MLARRLTEQNRWRFRRSRRRGTTDSPDFEQYELSGVDRSKRVEGASGLVVEARKRHLTTPSGVTTLCLKQLGLEQRERR